MANPTFQQMQHFYRLVEEGKIAARNFQVFLGKPDKFFEDVIYPITVDYNLSLAEMIKLGKYDWKNDCIPAVNFPLDGKGTADVKLHLVHLGHNATTKQVEAYLDSLDLQPAKIEHLLAFGAKYPNKQRNFPISALGSAGVLSNELRFVPCLCGYSAERDLNVQCDDTNGFWEGFYRFLAVEK